MRRRSFLGAVGSVLLGGAAPADVSSYARREACVGGRVIYADSDGAVEVLRDTTRAYPDAREFELMRFRVQIHANMIYGKFGSNYVRKVVNLSTMYGKFGSRE